MSHYTFDLDSYYKTDIYDLWKEILNCLCMKKMGLAIYLKDFTNLAEKETWFMHAIFLSPSNIISYLCPLQDRPCFMSNN